MQPVTSAACAPVGPTARYAIGRLTPPVDLVEPIGSTSGSDNLIGCVSLKSAGGKLVRNIPFSLTRPTRCSLHEGILRALFNA
jgi:hypothetical protein